MSDLLPVGDPVVAGRPGVPPARQDYDGRFVRLTPLDPRYAGVLHPPTHGSAAAEAVWTYLGYGPFPSVDAMADWVRKQSASVDPLFFAVIDKGAGRPVGVVSFLNIVADMRRLELGHIWYVPDAQRTRANTEAAYLILCETFDRLGYRRAEWKCDSLNARSKSAALRLGFLPEGVFRQHMVVKGRNRDTAWFSMLDTEWPAVKRTLEEWLYRGDEPGFSLTERHASRGSL